MYNWNFPLLVLLCVLNTIKADISLVDGREYSRERSLRSYHPDIRSLAQRNLQLRKGSPEIPVREKYRDIPILQDNRSESRTYTRTDQSRNDNQGLSRFQTNYYRLSFRQRQAEKTHYSRLVKNRVLSAERVDDANERRTLRNSNNLRTRSDIRQMRDIKERLPSLNRFNEIRRDNTRAVRCESSNSENRMIRSLENRQQVSRINREIEKRVSSSLLRDSVDNIRKINGPQYRAGINKENRQTINKNTRSDKQRDRVAPSVELSQMKRVTPLRQDIRKSRSITNDYQRVETIAVRREGEIKNEHSNRYELRLNERSISRVRDLSSRSFERVSFANTGASRAMYAMERDTEVRHYERNVRENENHRSLDVGVLRSLEVMNVRDNRETTVRERNVQMAQDARTHVQVRQRMIKTNIDLANSYYRDSIYRNTVVRREVRNSHPNERDARLNNNHRLSLRETERNIFRHTRESDRIRNSMDRNVRINERNTDVRLRSINRRDSTRSAERFRESTEILRDNTERNYLRSNDDRTFERRQQRTYTMRRTIFDERQIRRSNSKGESDEDTRMRQNVNRNVDRRLTTDNSANGRISQSVIRRQIREPRLTQQLEKNKRTREYELNFDYSRNTLSNMVNEENSSFTWQAAFYALQAIYICSIVLKVWNRTDSTKRKTWYSQWLSIPANKIE